MSKAKKPIMRNYSEIPGLERFYINNKTWEQKIKKADKIIKKIDEDGFLRYLIVINEKELLSFKVIKGEYRFFYIRTDIFGKKEIINVGRCPIPTFEKYIEPFLEKEWLSKG